jgi:Transglycosylase SLT domain
MRHLIIPACLCLAAWSSPTGPEPKLSLQNQISIGPVSTCCREVTLSYEQRLELPLARLHPLVKPIIPRSRQEICETLADAARQNDLPAPFLIRLLYQESSFRLGAISSAGALGIAQFMPETATDRRLDNPFDAVQAIPASARLLHDLYLKFGNLGLAAAAYNAGPKRIQDWLAKRGSLPPETQNYVKTVTGWPAETWATAQAGSPGLKLPQDAPCHEVGGLFAWSGSSGTVSSELGAAQQPAMDRVSDQKSSNPKATSPHGAGTRLPSRQINRGRTYGGHHIFQEGQRRHDTLRDRSVWSPEYEWFLP